MEVGMRNAWVHKDKHNMSRQVIESRENQITMDKKK